LSVRCELLADLTREHTCPGSVPESCAAIDPERDAPVARERDQVGRTHISPSSARPGGPETSPPSPPSPPLGWRLPGFAPNTAHRVVLLWAPPAWSIIRPRKLRRLKCRNL